MLKLLSRNKLLFNLKKKSILLDISLIILILEIIVMFYVYNQNSNNVKTTYGC